MPGEPGTSGRSGTIAIPDITSRLHPRSYAGTGPDAARNTRPAPVWELVPWEVDGGKPTFREDTVSAGTIIVIVVVLALVAAAAAVASMLLRRRTAERTMLGAEYDRLAGEVGPRKAQAEFAKRRQRVDGLGLRSLSDERRAAYADQWNVAQEQFIDSPAQSVRAAAAMIAAVTADRGYDVTDHERLLTDLSVYHGRYLDGYRRARKVADRAGQATTEELRQALLGYRVLFFDLLESPGYVRREPVRAPAPPARVTGQRTRRQVTQGRHGKTRRREEDADGVPAARS